MLNIYYWEKRSQNLSKKYISWKENLKKCTIFEKQKGTRYIRRNVYFSIIVFSCFSSTKSYLRFLLACFAREIKSFCQRSLRNKVNIRKIMNVSPNILVKNWNFKNLRHGFVDERTLATATLISYCDWKTLVPFCLWKEKPKNAFPTLTVDYQ